LVVGVTGSESLAGDARRYDPQMARVGLFGPPNVGKTTLFNALTGLGAPVAPHPLSTTEPNVGVAAIPDSRLEKLGQLEGSARTVHATLEVLDLPASDPAGFGAKYFGGLREVDALGIVLRTFESDAVPLDEPDPAVQAETLLLELCTADAEVMSRRAERAGKEATADQSMRLQAETYLKAAALLQEAQPLRTADWSRQEFEWFRDLAPLTLKPTVWVVNTSEDAQGGDEQRVAAVVPASDEVISVSAKIEAEAARLEPAERSELLEGLGLGEGALARTVAALYRSMGLLSFYTAAPKEARAWTVRAGATAPEAAGKIHTDLERGFIRAEVGAVADVIDAGGWEAAKASGLVRTEGKGYVVEEGDVLLIRFSV
jgi:GTP-binding protein YchF